MRYYNTHVYYDVNKSIQATQTSHVKISGLELLHSEVGPMPRQAKKRGPFAERLIQLRKAKGLSQYDLADISGVSQRIIAHYETIIRNPSSAVVLRLAKALKASPDVLMGIKPLKVGEEVSRQTIRKAKMLDELPAGDRKVVMQMIETLHGKKISNGK